MKSLALTLTITLIFSNVFAQEKKYLNTMLTTIEKMENSSGMDETLECASQFERIALAEKTLWMPFYYAAYSLISMSYDEADGVKRDLILERAQKNLENGMAISPEESELYALQAFLYPSWVIVDPMGRGMEYMQNINEALQKAKSFNSDNPRAYFLDAINKLNLPPSMGGGPEVAKPIFMEADVKFKAFHNDHPLWPVWGEEGNSEELDKLQ